MTPHGVSPRTVAIACLMTACALLLVVGTLAPTRPPHAPVEYVTANVVTPTLVPAITPLPVVTAGSPRPHWTQTPIVYVVDATQTPTRKD